MRSTMIAECTDCKTARCRFADSGNPVQVGTARHTSAEHGETRARYNIDPGYTIGGVVVLVGMMFLSIGLVMGAGLMKTFGAK